MQVQVTFDTDIPEEREMVEELFGDEELVEAAELSASAAASSQEEIQLDGLPDSAMETEDDSPSSEMVDVVQTDEGMIHLRFSNGRLSRAGEVVQLLLDNPWLTLREIAEALDWERGRTNSVLTASNASRIFINRTPLRDIDRRGGAYEWWVKHSLVTE